MNIIINRITLIAGIGLLIISSCRPQTGEDTQQKSVPVRVEAVQMEEIQTLIRTSGRLFTSSEQKLAFKTGGIVSKIYVSDGQEVKQGHLLAELKVDEIRAMLNQAGEAVEKTKRDFKRVENLYRDSVATLEQFENARTALRLAESQFEIARFNLQYSSIHAPADGRILRKLAENNEIVGPGYPVFLFGTSKGHWQLKANVTDREIVLIQTGDSAILGFDAHPGIDFPAMVNEKSAMADPYTGLFEISLELLPSKYQLVAGFIGRAVIFSGDKNSFFSIPVEALVEAYGNDGLVHLYEKGKPVKRNIKILRIEGNRILISGGLNGDEIVITNGTNFVKPGSSLKIINH